MTAKPDDAGTAIWGNIIVAGCSALLLITYFGLTPDDTAALIFVIAWLGLTVAAFS